MGLTKKGLSACRSFSLSFFSFGRSLNSKTDETFEILLNSAQVYQKWDIPLLRCGKAG